MKTSGFWALRGFRWGQVPFLLRNFSAVFSMRSRSPSVLQAVRWKCEEHSPAQSLVSWSVHLGLMVEPFNDRQENACPEYKQNCSSVLLTLFSGFPHQFPETTFVTSPKGEAHSSRKTSRFFWKVSHYSQVLSINPHYWLKNIVTAWK